MSSSLGLDVSDVVRVDIVIEPTPASNRNFGIGMLVGDSAVITGEERYRTYSNLDGVIADFGTTAPEYVAADSFFSQEPQPDIVQIGRWLATPSAGVLYGQGLSPTQQQITNFNSITTGSFTISVDGTSHNVTATNLTSATNLNAVAAAVQAKITAYATCVWNPTFNRFVITSNTTGVASIVLPTTPEGAGVDLGPLMGLTTAAGAQSEAGEAAESYTAALAALAAISAQWYCALPSTTNAIQNADMLGAAALIEGESPVRIMGVTDGNETIINTAYDPSGPGDLPSQLKALGYFRTFVQYSSGSTVAAVSMYARASTVDFTAQNSTLTLKFKQQPGVAAEFLSETQAVNLKAKNCNVFAAYNNSTSILQEGTMANGFFFDEVFNCDWLQNNVQTNLWNLLYTTPTKIPQTDPGIHQLVTNVNASLQQSVYNGMTGPGVYNGPDFGVLQNGDTLANGYYSYAAPVALQNPGDRIARKAPTIQSAITLAGAVHFSTVIINVTR